MKKRIALMLIGTLALGCEAFTAHVTVVARAGSSTLPVNRLAEVIAGSPNIPIERDVVELLAWRWVEFSLFAQRAARGDALLDSSHVVAAMWHDVHRAIVAGYHERVIGSRAVPTPAQVDSAYRVGELRIISHVLRRAPPDAMQPVRDEQRQIAQQVHDQLMTGGSWERANAFNQDTVARRDNGSLGALRRGQIIPQLENPAYALEEGEISPVVETRFGFHVLYRPPLAEVRAEFAEAVEADFVARLDSAYGIQLATSKSVGVQSGSARLLREAIASPFAARRSEQVLIRYDGGDFRVRDFVRWLEVLSDALVERLDGASDAQLERLARSLTIQELMRLQADSAGIALAPDDWERISNDYRRRIDVIRDLLTIHPDSLAARAGDMSQRLELADLVVDRYLEDAVRDTRLLVPLPQGLADVILEGEAWEIDPAGIQRVVERARQLRTLAPAGAVQPDSGSN